VEEGRKGGEMVSVCEGTARMGYGCGGGDENPWGSISVSCLRIRSSEEGRSQGGGRMLARRWRFKRRASQSGNGARWGGRRGCVGPCDQIISLTEDIMRRKAGGRGWNAGLVG
jgi:hypothetical protein